MSTPSTITPEIQKKVLQWGNMAVVIHNTEIELQSMAENAINELIIPDSIEKVESAEKALKASKSKYNEIETKRKAITSRFDSVAERLMSHEKSLKSKWPDVERAIIALKKIDQENKKKLENHSIELKAVKEHILNLINKYDAVYKQKISDQCSKAFNYALGKGNISEKDLPEYINKCKASKDFQENSFIWDLELPNLIYVTKEEALKIWNELLPSVPEGKKYVEIYHSELEKKFEFYNVALKNKEDAIEHEKQNALQAQQKIKEEQEAKATAAKLDALATSITPSVTSGLKELKKKYEVDLEDTKENAIKTIAAFVANMNLVEEGLRVKSWSALSIGQMASALAWYKNKDEKFECGIPFKQIDKL